LCLENSRKQFFPSLGSMSRVTLDLRPSLLIVTTQTPTNVCVYPKISASIPTSLNNRTYKGENNNYGTARGYCPRLIGRSLYKRQLQTSLFVVDCVRMCSVLWRHALYGARGRHAPPVLQLAHGGQGGSLVPPHTRGSVSLSISLCCSWHASAQERTLPPPSRKHAEQSWSHSRRAR